MESLRPPVSRTILWLGSSKQNLRDFPKGAQKLLGDEIQLIGKRFTEAQELRVRMKRRNPIKFEESSGNTFVDLGLEDSGELYARAQIGVHVFRILKDKKLKQREIAGVLGIAQPDVSHLMNGHFSRFTTDKLLDFLKRLNQKVKIEVSRRHKGEPYQQVIVASQR